MALDQEPVATATPASHPLIRVVLFAALSVAALLVLTALVGVTGSGPSLDIVADPAGAILSF